MAFSNAELAQIRLYLGYSPNRKQYNPRLESALTAISELDDDGATEDRMRLTLTKLETLETKIEELHCTAFVSNAGTDNVEIDSIRAIQFLKQEGRRLINQLCIPLGTKPMRDYFSQSDIDPDINGMSMFPYNEDRRYSPSDW